MKLQELINSVYMENGDQKKMISRFLEIIKTEINYDKNRKSGFVKNRILYDLYITNLKLKKDESYGAYFHAVKIYILDSNFRDKLSKVPKNLVEEISLWKEVLIFCHYLKKGPTAMDEALLLNEIEIVKNKYHKIGLKLFEERHGISFDIFNEEYQKDRNFLYLINALQGIKGF